MTIEIEFDDADGTLVAILDNHLVVRANREGDTVVLGKGFSRIEDDETRRRMKKVVEALLNPSP